MLETTRVKERVREREGAGTEREGGCYEERGWEHEGSERIDTISHNPGIYIYPSIAGTC